MYVDLHVKSSNYIVVALSIWLWLSLIGRFDRKLCNFVDYTMKLPETNNKTIMKNYDASKSWVPTLKNLTNHLTLGWFGLEV